MNENIIGVAMCGGQSSRMGSDKGMLTSQGITWSMLAFNKLCAIGIPAVVSINVSQAASYKKNFPADKLVIDSVDTYGPLKGILSVHENFPEHDLMLLACDMKDMHIEYLDKLLKSWMEQGSQYDSFLYKNGGHYEPLVGIYTAGFLKRISMLNTQDALVEYSMKSVISKGTVFEIEVSEAAKDFFANFNRPSELNLQSPQFK
jgi:molybdenum cofactor guanylyltransferase